MKKICIILYFIFFVSFTPFSFAENGRDTWYFFDGVVHHAIHVFPESDGTFECVVSLPTINTTFKKCRYKDNALKCLNDKVITFSQDGTKAFYSIYTLFQTLLTGAPEFTGHWKSNEDGKKEIYITMATSKMFDLSEHHPRDYWKKN